jgi:hypothetical protein
METARTILLTSYTLDQYGSNYGVYQYLQRLGINWLSVPILGSLGIVFSRANHMALIQSTVSVTVQFFLTWRIWTLGKNWIVTVVILLVRSVILIGLEQDLTFLRLLPPIGVQVSLLVFLLICKTIGQSSK